MEEGTELWESEGGALRRTGCQLTVAERVEPRLVPKRCNPVAAEQKRIGPVNQADSAEHFKLQASVEFDGVAKAFESPAGKQIDQNRTKTQSVIAILEEKWAEVMAKDHAGYFVHEWQELRDQVRQLIIQDPRYQVIKANRVAQ